MYLQDTSFIMEVSSSGSKQNSGKTKYQLLLIADLRKEIDMALRLDPEKIAAEIEKIGFSCQHCGKCCRRAFGDNRVAVIPAEIEKIRDHTGLSKLEVAGPLVPEVPSPAEEDDENENAGDEGFSGTGAGEYSSFSEVPGFLELLEEDIDSEGNIHAFGWMVRRKMNGDCIFLEKETNRCRVYPVRPMLCRTYPFYLEGLKLYTCECEGLGCPISGEESRKLAEALLSRYVSELEDMLAMYEKFENFEKGEKGPELARKNAEKGACTYIVHDSSGAVKIID